MRGINVLFLVILLAGLAGCSSPPIKMGIEVGSNLNPNENNEPLPVVARVYLLSDDQVFESAEFEMLWKDDLTVLGDSILGRQELVLTPASEKRVVMKRRDGAKFAAIMAIFREAQGGQWRAIKPLPDNYVSRRFSKSLHIRLNGNIVEFD
ncbi:MAG: type VI secretion system lipoprotein TssJ [Candidatus Thiodiazotropha sp. (ex Monitilora ramsayi)]|nr:type VI secretion system lipoprotein TssJ [Candidatus Thiodiazotropha sp. (ex Monitilora ramsayi)]